MELFSDLMTRQQVGEAISAQVPGLAERLLEEVVRQVPEPYRDEMRMRAARAIVRGVAPHTRPPREPVPMTFRKVVPGLPPMLVVK